MNIIQFLKPNRRKIILFIVLILISFGLSLFIPLIVFYCESCPWDCPPCPSGVLCNVCLPKITLYTLSDFWDYNYNPQAAFIKYLLVKLIVFYLISCLIFWIYNKIKNKSFQNPPYNYPMAQSDKNRQGGFSEKSLNPEFGFKSKTIKGTYETKITKDEGTIHGLQSNMVDSTKGLMEKGDFKKIFWQMDLAKKILDESTRENPHITDEELQQKIKSELAREKINRNESQSGNDEIQVKIDRENGNIKINISEKGTNINIINKKGLF